VPSDTPLWSWLFESQHFGSTTDSVGGFTDAETGEHVSYPDLKQQTTFLSTALTRHLHLQQGDAVILYGKNSIWYPVIALAAVRLGAIACGASPEYTVDELAYSLRLSKASCIFASPGTALQRALEAAGRVGLRSRNVICIDDKGASDRADTTTVRDLIQHAREYGIEKQVKPYVLPRGKTNREVCGWYCFSSGTTGLPKAVMISHANVMAQCLQIQQITPSDHTKILAALPFYHITGIVHQLHLPIILNATVYVMPTFSIDRMLETVANNKIRELLIVPPILIRLVREPAIAAKYDLSHVKRFSSGAAPLSKEILGLLESQFPGTGFKQGYGMTESCSAITSHPPAKYSFRYADKVGQIVASTEVKIVNPDTGLEEYDINKPGEIWARGPQIAMRYLDNPKATAESFDKDGFLHTGDIGKFDEEGLLSITDRMKEMIKVKGIGVAPAELEDLYLGHPLVRDVAVCGIPDERAGERPKAFVVLKSTDAAGASSSPASLTDVGHQLLDFAKSNKARHKWPIEIEFVHEIPKSAAGKILRRRLRVPSDSRTSNIIVRADGLRAKI
jgi:4-coumarate--CoA ligase